MRKFMTLAAVTASVLAAGMAVAQQRPADRIQAGTLTCDISGGLGFIIGSQKTLNCSFVPAIPGPPEFYAGVLSKLGIDLGGTTGGVMVWSVYAPTSRPAGAPCPGGTPRPADARLARRRGETRRTAQRLASSRLD